MAAAILKSVESTMAVMSSFGSSIFATPYSALSGHTGSAFSVLALPGDTRRTARSNAQSTATNLFFIKTPPSRERPEF